VQGAPWAPWCGLSALHSFMLSALPGRWPGLVWHRTFGATGCPPQGKLRYRRVELLLPTVKAKPVGDDPVTRPRKAARHAGAVASRTQSRDGTHSHTHKSVAWRPGRAASPAQSHGAESTPGSGSSPTPARRVTIRRREIQTKLLDRAEQGNSVGHGYGARRCRAARLDIKLVRKPIPPT